MRVIYEPEAEQELTDAAEYVAGRASSEMAGDALLVDAAAAEQLISEYPNAQPPLRGGLRRCLLTHHPYQLVYRVEGDVIRIFAFAHQKRKPGYWRKRVPR